jgi:NAD(P)-dependent dehydrogenase (short-subunit alcohol dehydrogenase family)
MLLENKVAVIYGAGGAIGGAVARGFAREGAWVFLAGRTLVKLEQVATDIRASGGKAETSVVDALDEKAVSSFVDALVKQAGAIDISFNLISVGDIQTPLMEIALDDFLQPISISLRTQYITTRAAARHMIPRRSGVILTFGGSGVQTMAGMGGFKVSLDALASLRRQWALELGPFGIRVVTLKTGGVPESLPETIPERDAIAASIHQAALLKRAASLADVASVAAFVASDQARTITATEVNISCGALFD